MARLWRHRGKALVAVAVAAALAFVVAGQLRGTTVGATQVRRSDVVQTVLVSGRVLPPAEVALAVRVEATVQALAAAEGDAVVAGAVLARLDSTVAEAEVAQARALAARARAASGRSRQIAPEVAERSLSTSEVRLAEARRTLDQADALVRSGAWPADRVLAAREAVSQAVNAERSAQLGLRAVEGPDRRVADANVDEALAALRLAEERLAHTTIRAPVAGVILERRIEAGDTARPGNVIFRLAAEGPPILSVDPDERHLSELAVGQIAHVATDAYADRPFEARVSFIAPAVDPERGTVEVRLLPATAVEFLRPNMTVSVEIEVARATQTLVVPSPLVYDASTDGPWVWVEEGGRLARRVVGIGLRGDEQLQITEGLSEGDRVLLVTDVRLAAGDRIRVVR